MRNKISTTQPSVSIVIPAYNASRFLRGTIDSILSQSFTAWELVIVDDGSTDDTLQVAGEYSHVDERICVVSQPNAGAAVARNTGISNSSACEFILFLDSDDRLEPTALEVLSTALQRDPDAVAAHGLARYVDLTGEDMRIGEAQRWSRDRLRVVGRTLESCDDTMPTDFSALAFKPYIITPATCLVRRCVVEAVGGFNNALRNAEDYNFWLRVSLRGPIAFVPKEVALYRIHAGGKSRNNPLMARRDTIARGQVLVTETVSPLQRATLVTGYRLKQKYDAVTRLQFSGEALRNRRVRDWLVETARAFRCLARAVRGMPRWSRHLTE